MTHPKEEQKNDTAMYHGSDNFNCGNCVYMMCVSEY